jgi:hypothetical protein
LLAPNQNAEEVTLSWAHSASSPSSELPPSTLLVSDDRSFTATHVWEYPLQGVKNSQINLKLPARTYFWRLVNGKTTLSRTGSFQISAIAEIKTIWPPNDGKVVTAQSASDHDFRWIPFPKTDDRDFSASDSDYGKHILEVASDPDFKNIIKSESVSSVAGNSRIHGLPPGTLYWRIKSRYGKLETSSPTSKFVLEETRKVNVIPEEPSRGDTVEMNSAMVFSWKSETEGLDYKFKLARVGARGESEKIIESDSLSNSFVWTRPSPGNYRWKTEASLNGKVNGETDWVPFTVFEGKPIELSSPADREVIYHWKEPRAFSYRWKGLNQLDGGRKYLVESAADADFTTRVESVELDSTELPSSALPPKEGLNFWRVSIVNGLHEKLKSGPPRNFLYDVHPKLEAPTKMLPAEEGFSFKVTRAHPGILLSWSAVKDAKEYELVVYGGYREHRELASENYLVHDHNVEKEIYRARTAQTSREVLNLPEGNYFWTVIPVDPLERLGESTDLLGFSVQSVDRIRAPKVLKAKVE